MRARAAEWLRRARPAAASPRPRSPGGHDEQAAVLRAPGKSRPRSRCRARAPGGCRLRASAPPDPPTDGSKLSPSPGRDAGSLCTGHPLQAKPFSPGCPSTLGSNCCAYADARGALELSCLNGFYPFYLLSSSRIINALVQVRPSLLR